MLNVENVAPMASSIRAIEKKYCHRFGFGVAPLQLAEMIVWGEEVGLYVLPAPEVKYASIRCIYGVKHVYINPSLPMGEKRMAIGHELAHMLTKDFTDELFPLAFAHLCLIPQTEMRLLEEAWGKMSPNRLYSTRKHWQMASEERAAQICVERVSLYRILQNET